MFPSSHRAARPVTNNGILLPPLRGYRSRQTVHGFRHLASTVLNQNGWNSDWIEKQLAHEEQRRSRRAYNAAEYLAGRREMLCWWANFLTEQKGLFGEGNRPHPPVKRSIH